MLLKIFCLLFHLDPTRLRREIAIERAHAETQLSFAELAKLNK